MNNDIFIRISILGPYVILALTAFSALFSWIHFKDRANRRNTAYITLLMLVTACSFMVSWGGVRGSIFNGALSLSPITNLMSGFFLFLAAFSILSSMDKSERQNLRDGEYYFLLIMTALGCVTLVSTREIFTMFVALEIVSMSVYGLAGITRNEAGTEAALKYFLLGSLASAFMVMALALIYGGAGTLNLDEIKGIVLYKNYEKLLLAGIILLMAGFVFKIALVPFHMWTPDVYEGAPTQVSALMASLVKTAGVIALLRLFVSVPAPAIKNVFWVFAALTIILANITALPQKSVKRILAYSSVSHAGYIILGFMGGEYWPVFYYAIVYSIATFGAFSVVLMLEKKQTGMAVADLRGLFKENPYIALAMSIFLFSLAGIPPLAGFFGKFYLFSAALGAGYVKLVLIAVMGSAISLYYYLKIIVAMFMENGEPDIETEISHNNLWNISVFAALTALLGVFSNGLIELLKRSLVNF